MFDETPNNTPETGETPTPTPDTTPETGETPTPDTPETENPPLTFEESAKIRLENIEYILEQDYKKIETLIEKMELILSTYGTPNI